MTTRFYYATNIFPANGVQTEWEFSFAGVDPDAVSGTTPYLYPADVKAEEQYINEDGDTVAITRVVTLTAANKAKIEGAPIANGRTVKIFRKTEIRFPLVNYRDRQAVSEFDLDLANRQSIFVTQETLDAATDNFGRDATGNFDAKNFRIINVADGIGDQDAVNIRQVMAWRTTFELNWRFLQPTYGVTQPTLRDNGAALQAGDMWMDGDTGITYSYHLPEGWLPVNIDAVSLASAGGSAMVGHGGVSVASALNTLTADVAAVTAIAAGIAPVATDVAALKTAGKGHVNVLTYGAIPGTDSTAAFIAADAAAAALGYDVYVPGVTSPFIVGNITTTANWFGNGEKSKIVRKAGSTGAWITIGGHSLTIRRMAIDGAFITGDCIEIDQKTDVEITDNVFFGSGGLQVHWNGCLGLVIERNRVMTGVNGFSNVMPVDSLVALTSAVIKIRNNDIRAIAGTGIFLAGKQSSTDAAYFFTNVLAADAELTGNVMRGVRGHGIIAQGRKISIVANLFTNVGSLPGRQSIVAQGDMITVTGNVIEGGEGVGIDMGRCTNSTVTGNTVRATKEIGIEIQGCTNTVCAGNTVDSCAGTLLGTNSAGINVGGGFWPGFVSSGAVVVGNTVKVGPSGGKYGISVDGNSKEIIVTGNNLINSGTVLPYVCHAGSSALAYGNMTSALEAGVFAISGDNPKLTTLSLNGNADFWMAPQGIGTLRVQKFMGTAATPANFSPVSYLPIKDTDGNIFYIPLATATW